MRMIVKTYIDLPSALRPQVVAYFEEALHQFKPNTSSLDVHKFITVQDIIVQDPKQYGPRNRVRETILSVAPNATVKKVK